MGGGMTGSMQWFRWHHGSVTDPKFNLVARRSGSTLPEVLAVWAFLLETASASAERGRYGEIDCESVDCLFGMEDGKTALIMDQMRQRGLIDGVTVSSWEKRQPKREDDTANERKRRQREREHELRMAAGVTSTPTRSDTPSHGGVTTDHAGVTTSHADVTPGHAREEEIRGEEIVNEANAVVAVSDGEQEPTAAQPAAAKAKRGVRLPDDWKLPKAWGEWALAEFPGWSADVVRMESDKFADYWRAKAGKDACKTDWAATWRNWCRNAKPSTTARPGAAAESFRERDDRLAREKMAAFLPGIAAKGPAANNVIDITPTPTPFTAIGA